MMGIDAATGTEEVLCSLGVEAIDAQELLTLDNSEAIHRDGSHDSAFSAAHRARASTRIHHPIWEIQFQHHAATVATRPVLTLDVGVADLSAGVQCHDCRLTTKFSDRTPTVQHAGARQQAAREARPPAAEHFMVGRFAATRS
jgi:hypothetical protein